MPAPTQLRTPIGGNCNADGNLTIRINQVSPSFYSVFSAVLQTSAGAPQWVLATAGTPVAFGGGAKVALGAIYLSPGDGLTITVINASPGAVVSGSLYGFLAADPEALPLLPIATAGGGSGTGALPSATTPWIVSGVAASQIQASQLSKTWDIPLGATNALLIVTNLSGAGGTMTVVGTQSGTQYIVRASGATSAVGRITLAGPTASAPLDTQLTLTWSGVGGANTAQYQMFFLTTPDLGAPGSPRNTVTIAWEEMAGTAAAESALTNFTSGVRDGVALAAATYWAVPNSKTLRIQTVTVYLKSSAAALIIGKCRIRQAAAVLNSSPIIFDVTLALPSATTAATEGIAMPVPIPEGLEVPGGQQITFTWNTTANTSTVGMTINGYEY